MHKESPSLKAQGNASTLEDNPMLWQKLLIHCPLESRMRPPPLARPGLPNYEPSVFSLTYPIPSLLHLTPEVFCLYFFCLLLVIAYVAVLLLAL